MQNKNKLIIPDRLQKPDDLYNQLIEVYEVLDETQAESFNLNLILLFANEIGDANRLKILIEEATKLIKQSD